MVSYINTEDFLHFLNPNKFNLANKTKKPIKYDNTNHNTNHKRFSWINLDYFVINDAKLIKTIKQIKKKDAPDYPYLYAEAQLAMYNHKKEKCYLQYDRFDYMTIKLNLQFVNKLIPALYSYYIAMNYMHQFKSRGVKRTIYNLRKDNPKTIDIGKFISPTKIKNYILEDPLCDYLDLYCKEKHGKSSSGIQRIFREGDQFESNIFEELQTKYPKDVIRISTTFHHIKSVEKYYETIKAIKTKIPIIYQGVLHNNINNTYGSPDLIMRGDFISKIFPVPWEINPDIYYILDMKNSTIFLNRNSDKIINKTKLIKYYKSQVYIYTCALGLIQGHFPTKAFIIAKTYKNKYFNVKTKTYEFLAPIDFKGEPEIKNITQKALKWITYLREHGHEWDPKNPHILELLPNFNNKFDYKWMDYKKKLLEHVSDVSELWTCSQQHRVTAFNNGVLNWRNHDNLTPELLGILPSKKNYKTIDLMIKMNKKVPHNILHPSVIQNNYKNWKKYTDSDIFIDFESVDDYIFLIGMSYYRDGKYEYRFFCMETLDEKSEMINLKEFLNFVEQNFESGVRLFHWGNYENTVLNKLVVKYDTSINNMELIDVLNIFKKEPIIIRGALNFGLKTIARAFYDHGLIDTIWKENSNLSGLNMLSYFKQYYSDKKEHIFEDIIDYNYNDCVIMQKIVRYLQKNNV